MKSIIYASFLALAILVSACSSLGITKRKYRKGYHWSIAKSSSTPQQKANALATKTEQAKESTTITKANDLKTESLSPIALTKVSSNPTEREVKPSLFNYKPCKVKPETNTLTASQNKIKLKKSVKSIPVLPKPTPLSKAKDNDIILIICCIFIPPLGVYLFHDDINIDFWIDLILCFLFWIPAVIFAFLVCFANVSLV
jgi:uncharacterized membrane protein YqaE (UPF0057 family)